MCIHHDIVTNNKKLDNFLKENGYFLREKINGDVYPDGQPEHEWQIYHDTGRVITWITPTDLLNIYKFGLQNGKE